MNIILFGIGFIFFILILLWIGEWWRNLPAEGMRRKKGL
jgi:hypothetical protein